MMTIQEALEPVVGEVVLDKQFTYVGGLIIDDLLSKELSDWHRYLVLETVLMLMHRTDPRHGDIRREHTVLNRKYRRKIVSQRKKLLDRYK